jgi:hypothetical protein
MDNIRINAHLMTVVHKAQDGKSHRELFIDFVQGSNVVARQNLFGHYFLTKNEKAVKQEFTFSPLGSPFSLDAFRRFVVDVKARREGSFSLDGAGGSTFGYRNNVLTFENTCLGSPLTIFIKYNDQLGRDLDELANTIGRYMEDSTEKEMSDFLSRIETLTVRVS